MSFAFTDSSQSQRWLGTFCILSVSCVVILARVMTWRRPFPDKSPKVWKGDDWPLLGTFRFFTARTDMIKHAQRLLATDNFSFYVGQKQVTSLSGLEGRKTFYESKDLDFLKGSTEMYKGTTPQFSDATEVVKWFNKNVVGQLSKVRLQSKLNILRNDTHRFWSLGSDTSSPNNTDWEVIDVFSDISLLIFQLTMRVLGPSEIAENPKLLKRTLSIFNDFGKFDNASEVIFPWLPVPQTLLRLYSITRLYLIYQNILSQRRKTGRRYEDTVQDHLDAGESTFKIVAFQVSSLFAAVSNESIMTAWIPVYWCLNPEWKDQARNEVDAAVAKHRTSADQTAADVLQTLTFDQWEAEFPIIDLSLRESIRLGLTGTLYRKNISGRHHPIGKTGEVIPKDGYAVFLLYSVHMDPQLYKDPESFDPGRYMQACDDLQKTPHSFVGWGSGRHPCLGMRFAKHETTLVAAHLLATYEFELSDADGNAVKTSPPVIKRNTVVKTPTQSVYIRYKPRKV